MRYWVDGKAKEEDDGLAENVRPPTAAFCEGAKVESGNLPFVSAPLRVWVLNWGQVASTDVRRVFCARE